MILKHLFLTAESWCLLHRTQKLEIARRAVKLPFKLSGNTVQCNCFSWMLQSDASLYNAAYLDANQRKVQSGSFMECRTTDATNDGSFSRPKWNPNCNEMHKSSIIIAIFVTGNVSTCQLMVFLISTQANRSDHWWRYRLELHRDQIYGQLCLHQNNRQRQAPTRWGPVCWGKIFHNSSLAGDSHQSWNLIACMWGSYFVNLCGGGEARETAKNYLILIRGHHFKCLNSHRLKTLWTPKTYHRWSWIFRLVLAFQKTNAQWIKTENFMQTQKPGDRLKGLKRARSSSVRYNTTILTGLW